MKKVVLASLLALAFISSAEAHGWHRYGGWHGGCWGCGSWVAPAVVGGVIGYELSRPSVVVTDPVYVQQQPVIVQPSVVQQPPVGYHWQEMIDPSTNTKKIVLVPN